MTTKPARAAVHHDFARTFEQLRSILQPYASKMNVTKDDGAWFYLETKEAVFRKKPMCFGGVRLGKQYVSFYLMTVYAGNLCAPVKEGTTEAKLASHGSKAAAALSAELKEHMQGKSCFNFKRPDAKLFDELAQLTKRGFEAYRKLGWA